MAESKKPDAAAEAAADANPAEQRIPSTPRDPGAIATPNVAVEVARPDAELLPLEMPEGRGQNLTETERARIATDAELTEARRQADEAYQRAQAEIRTRHREAVGSQIEEQRAAAMKDVEAQRERLRATQPQIGGVTILNPTAIELEGALIRSEAAALNLDETIPGGVYRIGNNMVDAHGTVLGPAE
jgi:hypothetical protein